MGRCSTLVALLPMLVATDDGSSTSNSTTPSVDYAGALRTFVDLWLDTAAQSTRHEMNATKLPPWSIWRSAPDPIQALLPAPMKPVHHPRSGCLSPDQQTICFPSIKFLSELLIDQHSRAGYRREPGYTCPNHPELTCYDASLPPGALVLELGPFLGESTVGLGHALLHSKLNATIVSVDTWHEHNANVGMFQRKRTWDPPATAIDAANKHPEWLASAGGSLLFAQWLRNVNDPASGILEEAGPPVLPVPLLNSTEVQARATALGSTGARPNGELPWNAF